MESLVWMCRESKSPSGSEMREERLMEVGELVEVERTMGVSGCSRSGGWNAEAVMENEEERSEEGERARMV